MQNPDFPSVRLTQNLSSSRCRTFLQLQLRRPRVSCLFRWHRGWRYSREYRVDAERYSGESTGQESSYDTLDPRWILDFALFLHSKCVRKFHILKSRIDDNVFWLSIDAPSKKLNIIFPGPSLCLQLAAIFQFAGGAYWVIVPCLGSFRAR